MVHYESKYNNQREDDELMHAYSFKPRESKKMPSIDMESARQYVNAHGDKPVRDMTWNEMKNFFIQYAQMKMGAQASNEFMKSSTWKTYLDQMYSYWLKNSKFGNAYHK